MTIIGYQFDKSKVTPESDASLYSYLAQGLDNKVIKGMIATASGLNLYIEPGKALVQGRFVDVTQQHQLSAQANTSGYVVITIDLTQTNTATGIPGTGDYEPVNNQLRLEVVESLNQQDLNNGGVIYTLPLYSYTSTGTSVLLTMYNPSFNLFASIKTTTKVVNVGYGRDVTLTRVGNFVTVTSQNRYSTAPTNGAWIRNISTFPLGFRPQEEVMIYNHDLSNVNKFSWNIFKPNGNIDLFSNGNIITTDYILTSGQFWITKDPWPD